MAKRPKLPTPTKASMIRDLVIKGKTNEQVLRAIRKVYRISTMHNVTYYRAQMQSQPERFVVTDRGIVWK